LEVFKCLLELMYTYIYKCKYINVIQDDTM
jgi:hypothetical protein